MTGPQKHKFRKDHKELLEVLACLSQKQLQVIVKYFNRCGVDHIGTLVHNLTKYKNPNILKENKKKLYKCLSENKKLATYLIKEDNNFRGKIKKLSSQQGGALITTLLAVGLPILAEIIASAVR